MKIGVIGGGAAGFFAALSCANHNPNAHITIFEKSNKLLSKVKVSGGGRCNVTNATFSHSALSGNYPRGEKFLKKCFGQFSTTDTIQWFEEKGVKLKTEADGRIFPVTDSSQTIIDCLLQQVQKHGIEIRKGVSIKQINTRDNGFRLSTDVDYIDVDKVIVATGGSPKLEGMKWLADLEHTIVPPVPSLFTFNMPKNPILQLQGLSVENAIVKVLGEKLSSAGPLLITHWGMSGPAILKLSAWGARLLNIKNYEFEISVNWSGLKNEDEVRGALSSFQTSKKKMNNERPFSLPSRLWGFILQKLDIDPNKKWEELGKKDINRLVNTLFNDTHKVHGKTTFKEEFVTCGGISLQDIDANTMESKACPGMYFCGEVMDIDGITGGFNFQAAWTTGFIAGKNVCG